MFYFVINKVSGSYNRYDEQRIRDLAVEYFQDQFKIVSTKKVDNRFYPDIDPDQLIDGDILVAVGGDGTLNLCLNFIYHKNIYKKIKLGIIPRGTGNNMLLALKLSKSIDTSFKILKNMDSTTLQFGIINDEHCFFNCSAGFSAYLLKNRKFKSRNGYLLDMILNYNYNPDESRVTFDNDEISESFFHLYFINTTHYLSMVPFLCRNSEDEQLKLFHTEKLPLLENMNLVSSMVINGGDIKVKSSDQFTLYPGDNCFVEIDGDCIDISDKYIFKYAGKVEVISNLDNFINNSIPEKITQSIFANRKE